EWLSPPSLALAGCLCFGGVAAATGVLATGCTAAGGVVGCGADALAAGSGSLCVAGVCAAGCVAGVLDTSALSALVGALAAGIAVVGAIAERLLLLHGMSLPKRTIRIIAIATSASTTAATNHGITAEVFLRVSTASSFSRRRFEMKSGCRPVWPGCGAI